MSKRNFGDAALQFPRYGATTNYQLNVIYRLFFDAAHHSQPCPSNDTIRAKVRDLAGSTITKYIHILENAGHIVIQRIAARRVVKITATGRQTQITAYDFANSATKSTKKPWSRGELIFLEDNISRMTTDEFVEKLKRSKVAIWSKLSDIRRARKAAGLPCQRPARSKPAATPKIADGRANNNRWTLPTGVTAADARAYKPRAITAAHKCRFPMWGPDDTDKTLFCRAPTVPGRPYCELHCARCYRAAPKPGDAADAA